MEKKSPPIEAFYCYAREDRTLRNELDTHLAGLRRSSLIRTWYDGEISPGAPWAETIKAHLESAQIILLLVSSDFFASDYCYSIEMARALERHQAGNARVIPILLRPTVWQVTPFAELQMLPTEAKPITSWSNRDEAWEDVAKSVYQVVNEFLDPHFIPSNTSIFTPSKEEIPRLVVLPAQGALDLIFSDRDQEYYFKGKKPNEHGEYIIKQDKNPGLPCFIISLIFLGICVVGIFFRGIDWTGAFWLLFLLLLTLGTLIGLYVSANPTYIITNERIIASTGKFPVKNREILPDTIKSVKVGFGKDSVIVDLEGGETFSIENVKEAPKARDAIQRLIYRQVYNQ